MTSFTISNMDYAPVKFMIKIFEANYPESLGAIVFHKSPWVFQGIWGIIKGWLDPVVASKVHFTRSVADLEQFIPRSQIVRELGGDETWNFEYLEPVAGENDTMQDDETRRRLQRERDGDIAEFQTKTFQWLAAAAGAGAATTTTDITTAQSSTDRHAIAKRLNEQYWLLDPYLRARSLYDRQGMISPGGKVDFYPKGPRLPASQQHQPEPEPQQPQLQENVKPATLASTTTANGVGDDTTVNGSEKIALAPMGSPAISPTTTMSEMVTAPTSPTDLN
jgi:hypothetical protein